MSIPIRRQYCLWPHPLLSCALAALVFWQSVTAQYNESIFSFDNSYPTVWWAVSGADRPTLANNAVRLRQDTIDRPLFARSVIVSLASGQRNEVAKSIGYMVNANSTFGGGCPVPPPPRQDLQRFGDAFAAAVLAADNQTQLWGTSLEQAAATLDTPNVTARTLKNVTGAVVADTILGALFVAGRTCGPPNALTSSLQSSVIAKYLNGTCFYIGPILDQLTLNGTRSIPAFNRTYTADLRLANETDPYVTAPVLTAYNECLNGPDSLQNPPSWLYYSFGPTVSIDDGPSNPLQTSSANLTSIALADTLRGFGKSKSPPPPPRPSPKSPPPPPRPSPKSPPPPPRSSPHPPPRHSPSPKPPPSPAHPQPPPPKAPLGTGSTLRYDLGH